MAKWLVDVDVQLVVSVKAANSEEAMERAGELVRWTRIEELPGTIRCDGIVAKWAHREELEA